MEMGELERYGARLKRIRLYKKERMLEAELELSRLLSAFEISEITDMIKNSVDGCSARLRARLASGDAADKSKDEFIAMLTRSWEFFSPLMKPLLKASRWEYGAGEASLSVPEELYPLARKYNGGDALSAFAAEVYGVELTISLRPDSALEAPKLTGEEDNAPADAAEGQNKKPGHVVRAPAPTPRKDIIMGSPVRTKPVPMSSVNEESGTVTVCGAILSIDTREKKTGGYIVNMAVTDKTNTLPVKFFPEAKDKGLIEKLEAIKASGDWITVHGRFSRDNYMGMFCLFANDIWRVNAVFREDSAEKKRVELHLHTKMSAMDGFIDPDAAIKTAARWGHKAVAITDHGVVQAFPAAVSAANKLTKAGSDIKAILGVEGYLLPDAELIPMEGSFTAISATLGEGIHEHDIYSLSAVRIRDGKLTDRFFTAVNSGAAIPEELLDELKLDGDMNDAPTTEEALSRLAVFIGGDIAVVHDTNVMLALHSRSKALKIELTSFCIAANTLVHNLHREKPTWAPTTNAECFAAMGTATPQDAAHSAEALAEMFLSAVRMMKERGIKCLPLWDSTPREKIKGKRSTYHIILLAKNVTGLKNLYKLVSYGHIEHLKGVPRIPRSLIIFHREGIIVGSACEAGELFHAVLEGESHERLVRIAREYDYLEVQPIGNNAFLVRNETVKNDEGLRELNKRIVALGDELSIPVVATGDAHFLDPEDAVFRAIVMSAREFKDAEQQAPLYFRTTDDMLKEFSYLGEEKAMEIVVDNPNAIADSCDRMMPFLSEKSTYSPEFENASEKLETMAEKRAHEIYGDTLPPVVEARLTKELNSIIGNGYASLYLSAEMLVKKSNSDGYLVGSRGSVGSSFVATMAGITEVNPLPPHYVCPNCRHSDFEVDTAKYACGIDLPDKLCPECGTKYQKLGYTIPFEVFLGFKGDKTPDIDLNFSGNYQPVAHKYVEVMFGEGHAFRAGTISGLQDKTVYGYIKGFCEENGNVYSRAETDRLVEGCRGVKRTTGQHPGGIIIVPDGYDIFDFTPIQFPADKKEKDTVTTHFDFHAMDDRLVKLDILGHDDPTALRMLEDMTGVDPKGIPLDDPDTMKIFSSIEPLGITLEELECDVGSIAIPEFGTGFVRQMLMNTRPTTMEELVRISGLSHGTDVWLGNAEEMVMDGTAKLNEVICTRDDIMNNLIARGEEPSVAFKTMESVRKGRGLKPEMEEAMRAVDTPEWFIRSCHKIKYLFPRAHAAAYVMMAFRVAYYKVHRPLEFYAVYFSARADAFDVEAAAGGEERVLRNIKAIRAKGNNAEPKEKDLMVILEVVYEMNRRGIALLPIDIYGSHATKFLVEGGALRPPFSAIAGVGGAAAEGLGLAAADGEYGSVEDFRKRTKANSAVIEKLRAMGCFDGMPEANQLTLF